MSEHEFSLRGRRDVITYSSRTENAYSGYIQYSIVQQLRLPKEVMTDHEIFHLSVKHKRTSIFLES